MIQFSNHKHRLSVPIHSKINIMINRCNGGMQDRIQIYHDQDFKITLHQLY